MKPPRKVVYYDDPVHDDFAGTNIETKVVDESFPYRHGRFFTAVSHVLYYAIALPLVWLMHRVVLGVRFVNRKNRRLVKGPCYVYGNHTSFFDSYTPSLLSFPRRADMLAGPDAFSIPGLRSVVQMLGAIAIPNRVSGMRPFFRAQEAAFRAGRDVTIFPEAHIWPYYTGVRPFPATSFSYPIRLNAPVFAFFTAYSEPEGIDKVLRRKATVRIYVSEPIYPDPNLPRKEAQQDLRDRVYAFMEEMSRTHSTNSVIEYVRRDPSANGTETPETAG